MKPASSHFDSNMTNVVMGVTDFVMGLTITPSLSFNGPYGTIPLMSGNRSLFDNGTTRCWACSNSAGLNGFSHSIVPYLVSVLLVQLNLM